MVRMKRRQGFTLIELLIVVAIIGLLAAIAIPNLLNAIQRAKQKRTMTDMRTIATAWEARAIDLNRYNAAGSISALAMCTEEVTHAELTSSVVPTYIKFIPARDGWNNPFRFRAESAMGDSSPASEYVIWSAGRNGDPSGSSGFDATASDPGGVTSNFNADIIYSRGTFVQYPEGSQN